MTAPPPQPSRPLDGEKTEMKPNFFCYTAEVDCSEGGGGKGKKFSFWNATDNTQFKVTFTFGEPQGIKILGDATQKGDDTYMCSLYPGEAKEFVQGRFKSMKRGLAFGPPDKEWQDKMAAATNVHVETEIAAMRAALKANPSKDGRYTADYISAVAVKEGIPFVDLTFPPKQSTLVRAFDEAGGLFKNLMLPWKRPFEYCPKDKHPKLYEGKIEPADLDQGEMLGSCYQMCAVACVAEFPEVIMGLFNVPRDPELGIYRMRCCKNGWWQVVTVDDLLPMKGDRPIFGKNREEPNELWCSIAEKVYAKLAGSYQGMARGDPTHAVADYVGVPYFKFKDMPEWEGESKDRLFEKLVKWDEESAVMTLGTPGLDPKNSGQKANAEMQALQKKYTDAGLVCGHAFALLGAEKRTQLPSLRDTVRNLSHALLHVLVPNQRDSTV